MDDRAAGRRCDTPRCGDANRNEHRNPFDSRRTSHGGRDDVRLRNTSAKKNTFVVFGLRLAQRRA